MNVLTKTPIRHGKETIPAGVIKPIEFFGAPAEYLVERGALEVVPEPPPAKPEPPPVRK